MSADAVVLTLKMPAVLKDAATAAGIAPPAPLPTKLADLDLLLLAELSLLEDAVFPPTLVADLGFTAPTLAPTPAV